MLCVVDTVLNLVDKLHQVLVLCQHVAAVFNHPDIADIDLIKSFKWPWQSHIETRFQGTCVLTKAQNDALLSFIDDVYCIKTNPDDNQQ